MKFIASFFVFLLGIVWMFNSFDWGSVTFTSSSLVASLVLLPKNDYWKEFKRKFSVKKQKIVLSADCVLETSDDKLFSIFEALVIESEIDLIVEHKGLAIFVKHAHKETSLHKKNAILKQIKRWEKELIFLRSCLIMMAEMYRKNYIHTSKEQVYSVFQELIKSSFSNSYDPQKKRICLYQNPYSGDSFVVSLNSNAFDEMLGSLQKTHSLDEATAYNALMMPGFYTVSDLSNDFVQSNFLSAHIAHLVSYGLDENSMYLNSWYIGLQ
ncbi:hypothetical protein [Vibrio sp. ZOR0018]|uniref:hypothetical protein n=1 Tax=Vibrio sp. ZOR0018 TaxID=1339225 RepID=UPI000647BE34|nr:hypothetical protein [Vibrio sp. ZOR0018]